MAELGFRQTCVSNPSWNCDSCPGAWDVSSCSSQQFFWLRIQICQYVHARPWFQPFTRVPSVAANGIIVVDIMRILISFSFERIICQPYREHVECCPFNLLENSIASQKTIHKGTSFFTTIKGNRRSQYFWAATEGGAGNEIQVQAKRQAVPRRRLRGRLPRVPSRAKGFISTWCAS